MEKIIDKKASEVIITFKTSGEEWNSAQMKEFNKLRAKLKVPGFRPGHVPDGLAKQKINPAEVIHEAMFALVNKAYAEVLESEKLMVIAEPKLTVNNVSKTELECVVTVALPPVVTLGEYKGIKVEKEAVSVTEEDIKAEIEKQLSSHATLMVKEEAAKLGDTVIIDFKGFVDDVPFDGGEAKAYELKLGSNSFIPGFEDQLVGITAGESRSINVQFPENYVEQLAGKAARFDIKCHDVKETVLPELNDEFVEELELADIKTVDAYKAKLEKDILARKEAASNNKRLDTIVAKIIDNATVEIADTLVEDEAKAQVENVRKQVESNGLKFEDYLKINNTDLEKFTADRKAEAANNIKGMLVIEQICRQEKIEVDAKALNDKYEELAAMYNMKVEDVRKALEPNKNEVLRNLKNELFTKFILANNE